VGSAPLVEGSMVVVSCYFAWYKSRDSSFGHSLRVSRTWTAQMDPRVFKREIRLKTKERMGKRLGRLVIATLPGMERCSSLGGCRQRNIACKQKRVRRVLDRTTRKGQDITNTYRHDHREQNDTRLPQAQRFEGSVVAIWGCTYRSLRERSGPTSPSIEPHRDQ
jgi:hypothetical protein